MMGKRYELDMCRGAIAGKLLVFALPLMLSGMLQLLFNAVDVVVVGRYCGKESLAAVGSNTSLINLFINLFVGLSVGANVIVAQDLGAGREKEANRAVHSTILLAMVSGVALLAAGQVFGRQMLEWMDSPDSVIELATLYLKVYFLGMPATMVYNFGAAILRAKGDTKRPLYYLTLAGVVNVALNMVFVVYFHWDVAGVAAATGIAQYISAALVLRCLLKEEGVLHLDLKQLRFDKQVFGRIARVGLPAGLQGVIFALSNVVIQSAVNSFGDVVMAGSSAAASIEGFVYVAMNAFYQAAITFTGQNYGAGKCDRVDRVAVWCVGYSVLTGLVLGNLIYAFGPQLISIYSPGEAEVIAAGMMRMKMIGKIYFLAGMMEAFVGVLRGLGHSIVPMICSLVGSCVLRLIWVATIFPMFNTPTMLFISYPITWIITTAAHVTVFLAVRKKSYRLVGYQI